MKGMDLEEMTLETCGKSILSTKKNLNLHNLETCGKER